MREPKGHLDNNEIKRKERKYRQPIKYGSVLHRKKLIRGEEEPSGDKKVGNMAVVAHHYNNVSLFRGGSKAVCHTDCLDALLFLIGGPRLLLLVRQ